MAKIKRYNEFEKTNEIFGKFAELVGGLSAKVLKKGASFYQDEPGTEDDDLATRILSILQKMPTTYNTSGVFNPNTINKKAENWYYFIDSSSSSDEYKIDIIKHLDFRRNNQDEYSIIVTKVSPKHLPGVFTFKDASGVEHSFRKYADHGTGNELNISPKIAKKIFDLAQSINNKVSKTDKQDYRNP